METVVTPPQFIDLHGLKARDGARFERLLAAFVDLYAAAFPDASESEDPKTWPARMDGTLAPPQPHMFIILALRSDDQLVGGICAEHYRESSCGLITYIAVEPGERRRRIGRDLLQRAKARLNEAGEAAGQPLHAILAEAEIPSEVPAEYQNEARVRVGILGRLQARPLDVAYVQPELGPDKIRARHLMLLVFDYPGQALKRDVLRGFLHEFYHALTGTTPDGDPDFEAMLSEHGDFAVADLEDPALAARDVAVCLHYVTESSTTHEHSPENRCPVFHSMETDLLAYGFQSSPPFETVCKGITGGTIDRHFDYGIPVEVRYPAVTTYESEGRRNHLYCWQRRRRFRAYVACTRFFRSNIAVWHVVLRPAEGTTLSEFDIIKLAKLYAGSAEGTKLLGRNGIRFYREGKDRGDAEQLLQLLLDDPQAPAREPIAGTIEWSVEGENPDAAALLLLARKGQRGMSGLADDVNASAPRGREAKALCGVITGILDFQEIGGAELVDTLAATFDLKGTYIRVHRSTLVQVCEGDRAMQAVRRTVGISPYLIIPHAAVLYNERLLGDAEVAVSTKDSADPLYALTGNDARRLQKTHRAVNYRLRDAWLQNVFAYQTERKLFQVALASRGARDRYKGLAQKAKDMESSIDQRWDLRRDAAQVLVTSILAFLAVLQVKDAFYDYLGTVGNSPKLVFLVLAAFLVALLIGLVGLRGLRKRDDT